MAQVYLGRKNIGTTIVAAGTNPDTATIVLFSYARHNVHRHCRGKPALLGQHDRGTTAVFCFSAGIISKQLHGGAYIAKPKNAKY